ncbi:hypothetical protein HDU78_009919 [Chytriomyces hyalinus]|nr:hypothetical protein HDU78_009919 [Chytriomyces hyalinus]
MSASSLTRAFAVAAAALLAAATTAVSAAPADATTDSNNNNSNSNSNIGMGMGAGPTTWSTEASKVILWGGVFPTYACGVFLNGLILFVILYNRRTLLLHRIDFVYLFLLSVCMLFSVVFTVRFVVSIAYNFEVEDNDVFARVVAAITSVSIFFIFTANVFLAAERYFTFREVSDRQSLKYFVGLAVHNFLMAAAIVVTFILSPTTNRSWPDDPIPRIIWFTVIIWSFVLGFGLIVYLYFSTYRLVSRQLKDTLSNHKMDELRILLERNVLKNSIIMSAAIIVCYMPNALWLGISRLFTREQRMLGLNITYELVALDVIITPFLLLYFVPPIREALSGLSRGRMNERWEDDEYHTTY